MAERGYGSNLRVSTGPTVAQQRNVDRTRAEQNAHAAWSGRETRHIAPKKLGPGEIPGVRKPGSPLPATPASIPGVVRPVAPSQGLHNARQFKGMFGRVAGMLRRGR